MKAPNDLDIPYVGYLELDFQMLGKKVPGQGVLVVKDKVHHSHILSQD